MSQKEKGFLLPIIFIAISVLLMVGAYYLGTTKTSNSPQLTNLLKESEEQTTQPLSSNLPSTKVEVRSAAQQYTRTDFMGPYSFEYPSGWHVASYWPDGGSGPITIGINPKPINGGPRDGPVASIDISEWNGLPNPEAKLTDSLLDWKKAFKAGFKEEVLQSELGQVYYYSGKLIGPMLEDTPMEVYVFLIPAVTPSDKLNYRVVQISSLNNSASSEILRHVALSFKRIY